MKFYIRKYREPRPNIKNIFVLTSNTWNDYGTVSLFMLGYVDEDGEYREIGETKILSTENIDKKPLSVNSVTSFADPSPPWTTGTSHWVRRKDTTQTSTSFCPKTLATSSSSRFAISLGTQSWHTHSSPRVSFETPCFG